MQDLDGRLEHLDELEHALVGEAQPARVAVCVRVVLREALELADVELAHQRRDVLVVLVARLGLGDRDLLQHRRAQLHDSKSGDVATVLVQALDRPRRHDRVQVAARDAELGFDRGAVLERREQTERRLVHRRTLQRVEGHQFHQVLEFLGERGLAATRRAQQVEDLLAFLERLRRVLEERDHLLDGLLHAVELAECGIDPHHLVREDPREARIGPGVEQFGLADRHQHALGCARVGAAIALAELEVLLQRVLLLEPCLVAGLEASDDARTTRLLRERDAACSQSCGAFV